MAANKKNHDLKGHSVAVLATNGFEQVELLRPLEELQEAGADVSVIGLPDDGESIRGWEHDKWGESVSLDGTVRNHKAHNFDALVLPGGVMNPDFLRQNEEAVKFVHDFFDAGKPVAAICHGPWMLVEADVAPRTEADLVAFAAHGPEERRRGVGGRGGRRGLGARHQPQPRRPGRVLLQDAGRDLGGRAPVPARVTP